MTNNGHTISVNVEVDLENDIEVDDDGVLQVCTLIYQDEEDEPLEVKTPLNEIITGVLEYYADDLSREGYGEMYRLGHELRKVAERVLDVAERHEDLVNGEGTYPETEDEDWLPYDQHNTATKGRIGEYFVAFLLEREGIEASIVDRVGTDLFCRRPNGEMFSVEVKTAVKGILSNANAKTPRMNYNIKSVNSDWYAFVDLSTELVVFRPRSELEKHANKTFYLTSKDFSPHEMKKTLQQVKGRVQ